MMKLDVRPQQSGKTTEICNRLKYDPSTVTIVSNYSRAKQLQDLLVYQYEFARKEALAR